MVGKQMAPLPEDCGSHVDADSATYDGNDIVISGMSGVMPECHNLMEFDEKLYNKVNMVTKENCRWNYEHPELPEYAGKMPDVDLFDAEPFAVHSRLAKVFDPMTRLLLEQTYQALFDAGVNPTELSSKRVGVYVAVSPSETEKVIACSSAATGNSYKRTGLQACSRAMSANRISYWLNVNGPSMVIDCACCGSVVALEKAYQAILHGDCDSAVVGGAKLLLHPQTYIRYQRVIPVNRDGKTKSYDMNADGQSESEAAVSVYLQRRKDAKRIYASLRHVKTGFGVGENFWKNYGPGRDVTCAVNFLSEFYKEAKLSPSLVEYVEGFGAAIPESDKSELEAIDKIFCDKRKKPLLVGSVLSNIGYTEAACGLSALVKVLLAYHKGQIAATLNCDTPRDDVNGLCEGRMRIVTDHHPFQRSYAALNQLSFTGVNGHVLLQGQFKSKNIERYACDLPYLVTVSGRREDSVKKIIDDLKSRRIDPEEIALLHSFYKSPTCHHMAWGYGIYSSTEQAIISEDVKLTDVAKRPLWFVYSGMGSQWNCMGAQLLRIPIFAAAIERCRRVLEPRGVDIIHILTSSDKTVYDHILNSFVGIAAVQIGLTDILNSIGLVPDKIIGHSVGELGCAYADGCFTAEEMILAAYSRGLVSVQTPLIYGSMAAVGLGYKKISKMCPPEIEVACHNGPNSSTISGPAEVMRTFVAQLTKEGIFAKEVPCSNIAYHSRYIAKAGPALLKCLKEVIKEPKLRSEKWLSTSVPMDRWDEASAKYSSAEYHTNNLLSPVLFEETSTLVPANAVLVEVAPHGLLQAILKRSLPDSCQYVPLTRRDHADNTVFLLKALGKIYMEGYEIDVGALYPKVEFPVSTATRQLSHLVKWLHPGPMGVQYFTSASRKHATIYKPIISLYDAENEYLTGHIIEGSTVFPFAGALVLVWDTIAMNVGKKRQEVSIDFQDVHLYEQPRLFYQRPLHLKVTIQSGSGQFEVTHNNILVATGCVSQMECDIYSDNIDEVYSLDVNGNDIYKLLYEKGYEYKGDFRSIIGTNQSLTKAQLVWNKNWVTLIDSVIQLNALRHGHAAVSQPMFIKSITINVKKHLQDIMLHRENVSVINAQVYEVHNRTRCGGLLIQNIVFKDKAILAKQSFGLKSLEFRPFFHNENQDMLSTIYMFLQIVAENLNKKELTVVEVINNNESVLDEIQHLLNSPPKLKVNVLRIRKTEIINSNKNLQKLDVLFIYDLLSDKNMLETLLQALPQNIFLISFGVEVVDNYTSLYNVVSAAGYGKSKAELALWRPETDPITDVVSVKTPKDLELLRTLRSNSTSRHKRVIISSYPPVPGLRDLVNEFRANKEDIYVAMINFDSCKEGDLERLPNFKLVFNVMDQGIWGGEFFSPLNKDSNKTESSFALQSVRIGDINSLHWVKAPEPSGPGIPVTVHYIGLNTTDASRAIAEAVDSTSEGYAMDFSGLTDSGESVMGLVSGGAARRKLLASKNLLWPVPAHWTLEEAATVPLPYAIAFYCLAIKSKLYEGMSILVHGGAGALGQAVISIALAHDCQVFTTVSDIRKKGFLKKLFPELKDDHIGNSRDATFRDMVMFSTKGKGCNIVISCVRGKLRSISIKCGSLAGIVFDTALVKNQEKFTYQMGCLDRECAYNLVNFSSLFNLQNESELKDLQLMIAHGISQGYVRPLSRVTYPPQDVARAFRLLAASRHRGRVLIRLNESPITQQRLICSPEECYAILCDDEGFGLQIADHLVDSGVRKLNVLCPSTSGYLDFKKRLWEQNGAQLKISHGNLDDKEKIDSFLNKSNDMGPVRAIFFVATENNDDEYTNKLNSMVGFLDSTSRKKFNSLKNFVIISEGSNIGREICLERAKSGLPALSLCLKDLAKFEGSKNRSFDQCLKSHDAFILLERALYSQKTVVATFERNADEYNLIEEIGKISGMKINNNSPEDFTLEMLGLGDEHVQELYSVLNSKFKLSLPKECLLQLTIVKLKKLCEKNNDVNLKTKSSGFEGYLTNSVFEKDEVNATADVIQVPTLLYRSKRRGDEFIACETYLCIVPGMEGHRDRFKALCERLKLPAIMLFPEVNRPDETLREVAQRLVNVMMKKLKTKNNFYLLGYEFGVLLALEMCAVLESYGKTGTVYCVGGTPEDIHSSVTSHLGDLGSEKLQNSLLEHVYQLIVGNKSETMGADLLKARTWDDKLNTCLKALRGKMKNTGQYMRAVIESAYFKIQLLNKNHRKKFGPFRSKIVVLKAVLPVSSDFQTDSQSLLSNEPLDLHELSAALPYATEDMRCSAIINKYLSQDYLDEFNSRNQCESYLLDDTEYNSTANAADM